MGIGAAMNNWPGKNRPRFRPLGRHGKVKRILGDTPMKTLQEAYAETMAKDTSPEALADYYRKHQQEIIELSVKMPWVVVESDDGDHR